MIGLNLVGQLPKTSIHIVELKNLFGKPSILDVSYITSFNGDGYNNQPYFLEYDKLLMTLCLGNSNHPDVFYLDLASNTYNKVTATEGLGEYSPTLRPSSNLISCVRTEKDGKTQSLWTYPTDRSSIGSRLLRSISNVGYYNWISSDTVAIFLVKDPNELKIFDIKSGLSQSIATNTGRSLRSKDQKLYYVDKSVQNNWGLRVYDFKTSTSSLVINMPTGVEDFDLLSNGAFIIGDNTKLYTHNPSSDYGWNLLGDLSHLNIKKISRISSFKDRLAIVTSNE